VLHAAVSGISAVISPEGEVRAEAPLWTERTLVVDVTFADDVTFYARTGEWLPILSYVVVFLVLAWSLLRGRRSG
jgi:apolipoprotein N-acyltransferase